MNQIVEIFSMLYPITLFVSVFMFAIWGLFDLKKKKSKILNFLVFISVLLYFVSLFSNYNFELFLILWFLRDLLIFIILIKISDKLMKHKVLAIISVIIVVLGVGFFVYQKGGLVLLNSKSKSLEFDNSAELLFDIKKQNELHKIEELLKEYKPEIIKAFPHIESNSITELDDYYTIDIEDTKNLSAIIERLENSNLIDWVEYNEIYKLSPIEQSVEEQKTKNEFSSKSLNDPYITNLWGFNYMDIDKLIDLLNNRKHNKKAKIFILDTGVDSQHEDLNDNYISLSKKYDEDTGIHGTHCAGIACAVSNNNIGIASLNLTGEFTTITSITVLPNGSGTQESVIDGIILAADNEADVISMSLGGISTDTRQEAYNKAIKYANDKGAIVVVAAGNESRNAIKYVPASCKGVITVSAVDQHLEKASFSNYVSDIEYKVAAPGVNIFSTTPKNKYQSLNGTSMATPYVAGLVGIMKSIKPELSTNEVFNILNSTGIDTKNSELTGKFIQPYNIIDQLETIKNNSWIMRFFRKLFTFKP